MTTAGFTAKKGWGLLISKLCTCVCVCLCNHASGRTCYRVHKRTTEIGDGRPLILTLITNIVFSYYPSPLLTISTNRSWSLERCYKLGRFNHHVARGPLSRADLQPGREYLISVNSMNAKHGASAFTDPIHVRTEFCKSNDKTLPDR